MKRDRSSSSDPESSYSDSEENSSSEDQNVSDSEENSSSEDQEDQNVLVSVDNSSPENQNTLNQGISLNNSPLLFNRKRRRFTFPNIPETIAKLLETDSLDYSNQTTPIQMETVANFQKICKNYHFGDECKLAECLGKFLQNIIKHITQLFQKWFSSTQIINTISEIQNGSSLLVSFNYFYEEFKSFGFSQEEADKYVPNLIARACLHPDNQQKAPAFFAFMISRPESELDLSYLKYTPLVKALMKLNPEIILKNIDCDDYVIAQKENSCETISLTKGFISSPVLEFLCGSDAYDYVSTGLFQFLEQEKLLTQNVLTHLRQSKSFHQELRMNNRHALADYLQKNHQFPKIETVDTHRDDNELFFANGKPEKNSMLGFIGVNI